MNAALKLLLVFISLSEIILPPYQEVLKTTTAEVGFFSSAPVEDIQATSREGISIIKPETGEILFRVYIRSLKFPKALMQEHFNENFMESDLYPTATFSGKINPPLNFKTQGEVSVILSGILDIHGVKQKREIPAVIQINNDKIILKSSFNVACEDHKIKIPKLLWRNIAEVVKVDVNANYKR